MKQRSAVIAERRHQKFLKQITDMLEEMHEQMVESIQAIRISPDEKKGRE